MSWFFGERWGWGRGLAFFVALLSLSMASASSAFAVLIMEYEQILEIVTNEDRGVRPTGVTCDGVSGDVCVTDAQHSGFYVFNKHGVEVFRTGGTSQLSSPVDGSFTSDGDFVFVGKDRDGITTIRRLNFMGEPVEFTPEVPIEGWEPSHLIVTRDGGILTLDSFERILTRHDSTTGALVWLAEIPYDGSDDLRMGRPAEAPDGRIYVPCGILHKVMVFSEDGRQLEAIGEFGSGTGKLVFPVGVAIGPGETILVLDSMRQKVVMFDSGHNFLSDFGSMGAGLGQFYYPSAIAASKNGKVYVAQGYGSRVQVFNIRDTQVE